MRKALIPFIGVRKERSEDGKKGSDRDVKFIVLAFFLEKDTK
jgi:hypothetical protein